MGSANFGGFGGGFGGNASKWSIGGFIDDLTNLRNELEDNLGMDSKESKEIQNLKVLEQQFAEKQQ